jgi:benzoylformate decarboxylase
MTRTVRRATHELMAELGLTTIFGNPGSTELRFLHDLPAGVRYVTALQEASAVAMADGFAQASGNAALVNLHSAVGVGHALGSIFTAMRNHAPVVVTAGQQTRAMLATEPFLFAEQAADFPKPYVKWSCEPARPQDVPGALARAYATAMQPPMGPTFVSIPEDDWEAPAEPELPARRVDAAFVGDPVGLTAVAAALAASNRPALVVGPGVDRDGAWDGVVELAERCAAAVWVAPVSSRCSFPEDHPAFAGFLPPHRAKLKACLAGHDVVVVLGAPVFTYHVHAEGPFLAEGTVLFQLVDDPGVAARAPVGRAILTTLRAGIDAVLAGLGLSGLGPSGRPAPVGRPQPTEPPAADPITAAYAIHTLARLLPPDAVVVEEAPSHRNAVHDHLPIRSPGGFYAAASGGLGWALPAAVGIALAEPARPVVSLLGDGSSLYSIQALWTAAQLRLPITFAILDNQGYAALKSLGLAMGMERPPGVDLPGLRLTDLATGFGCDAIAVEKAEQLEPALRTALGAREPTVVVIAVDPSITLLY